MKKKLLFTLLFCTTCFVFSQEKTIFKLSAAPNPFTNSTKITFSSTTSEQTTFTVKNVLGKTVYKQNFKITKGNNSIPFSKGNLSKGIYIYTLQSKKQITSKRFVIQ